MRVKSGLDSMPEGAFGAGDRAAALRQYMEMKARGGSNAGNLGGMAEVPEAGPALRAPPVRPQPAPRPQTSLSQIAGRYGAGGSAGAEAAASGASAEAAGMKPYLDVMEAGDKTAIASRIPDTATGLRGIAARVGTALRPVTSFAQKVAAPAAAAGLGYGMMSDAYRLKNVASDAMNPLDSPLANAAAAAGAVLDQFQSPNVRLAIAQARAADQASAGLSGMEAVRARARALQAFPVTPQLGLRGVPFIQHLDPVTIAEGIVSGAASLAGRGIKSAYDWATTAPGDGGMSVQPEAPMSVDDRPVMSMPSDEADASRPGPGSPEAIRPSTGPGTGAPGKKRGGGVKKPASTSDTPAPASAGPGYQRSNLSLGVPRLRLDRLAREVGVGMDLPGGGTEGGYAINDTSPSPFTRPNTRVGGSMLGTAPGMDRIEAEGRRLPLGAAEMTMPIKGDSQPPLKKYPGAIKSKLPSGATQPFMPDPALRQNIGAEVSAHTPTGNLGDMKVNSLSPIRPATTLPRSRVIAKHGDVEELEPLPDDETEEEKRQRERAVNGMTAINRALRDPLFN